MSYAVWVAAVVTAGLFAADWWAVWHQRHDVERLAKPAAMVGLLSVALLAGATDSTAGRWLLLALVLGLVGDVLPARGHPEPVRRRAGGVPRRAPGLRRVVRRPWGSTGRRWAGSARLVLLVALVVGRRILPGAVADGGAALAVPVAVYMAVIGAMAVTGWATGRPLVGLGASLFVVSDTVLAMGRFVQARRWTSWSSW